MVKVRHDYSPLSFNRDGHIYASLCTSVTSLGTVLLKCLRKTQKLSTNFEYWAQFHNNLIIIKFNPKYFSQN